VTAKDTPPSILDRRRDKARAATAAADTARQKVADIDARRTTIDTEIQQHETALQQARDEVKRRTKALKESAGRRDKLRKDRARAVAAATKARRKARAADEKYDRAVLADLLRREKKRDLAEHRSARPDPKPAPARTEDPTPPDVAPPAAAETAGSADRSTAKPSSTAS
jgi:chromosome segregation ATPase